jgi:hypothetical protein
MTEVRDSLSHPEAAPMNTHRATLYATLLALTCVPAAAPARAAADDPAPPPAQEETPPAPAPAPAPAPSPSPEPPAADASQEKARVVLGKAAARQDAGDLAEPGKLDSFHVVFHKATFESTKTSADGKSETTQMIQTDDGGLVFDWKQGSVKTQLTVDERTTTKSWYEPLKYGWFYDGEKVQSLLGAEHKADYDQLQFHRRVIDQLLDVAILSKLLRDKSVWSVIEGAKPFAAEGDDVGAAVAVKRTPPADNPNALPVTLWIAHPSAEEYGDVVAASMPPLEPGGATLLYRFAYHESFPKVRVKTGDAEPADAKLRFPFKVTVHEKLPGAAEPRKVLEVFTRSVDVNTVTDDAFKRPKPR